MSTIARCGEGVSHVIGVGGRDLSDAVGGLAMEQAIDALAADPATSVVCVIGKPPGGTVARRLESQIARLGKPCALHFVGSTTASLEDCARDAVALARGEKHQPVAFTIPDAEVAHMVSEARRGRRPEQRFVRGVYSGGTLAWEARSVLDTTLGDVAPGVTGTGGGHRVVDLGEDVFTFGRPHPMIDGTVRREWIAREAADPSTAALLLDIVLGHGAHPDPAGELLPAIDAARTRRAGVVARSRSWRASRAPTPIPRIEAPRSPACAAPAPSSCRRTHRPRALRAGSPPAQTAPPSPTRLHRRPRLRADDRLPRRRCPAH